MTGEPIPGIGLIGLGIGLSVSASVLKPAVKELQKTVKEKKDHNRRHHLL